MAKILVIEDETILREEVVEWLTMEGYEALSAEDGVPGVEVALRQRPDLILCDITMPQLDGYGVLLELHANPATARIPFIFITARVAHEDIRLGMRLGADDYLTKPFTRVELLQAIQTRLTKKSAQEQEHQQEVDQLRQALAQAQEQHILKAKFVAMFSHDFRNPLTSILMSSNLLRLYAGRIDEKRRLTYLNRVEASVRQLLQMLDDMLIVAQLEVGNLNLKLEPLNVGQFLQRIVEDFQTIYDEKRQIIYENYSHAPVMMDARMLRQIASNLLSNALKYSSQEQAVRVRVETDKGRCLVTIQDRGIGIPEVEQTRLFETFRRGSNVGDVPGTGLGLAIVKQAVDLQHGSVQIESQEGLGTKVTVSIPITQRNYAASPPPSLS